MAKNPLRRNKRAQGMTEYIIIVGLIAIAVIAAVNTFSGSVSGSFTKASEKVAAESIIKEGPAEAAQPATRLGANNPNQDP